MGHRELLIISCLDPISQGDTINRDHWPRHITILPWFKGDFSLVNAQLEELAARHPRIKIVGRGEDHFGHHDKKLVRLVESDALHRLHNYLLAHVKNWHARLLVDAHTGADYTPHITKHSDNWFGEGEVFTLNKIELIERDTVHAQLVHVKRQYELKGGYETET